MNNIGFHPPFKQKFNYILSRPEIEFGVLTGDIVSPFPSIQDWDEIDADIDNLGLPVYFAVGNQITVIGTAQLNLFEKRDGSTGCSVRINVSSMSIPPKQTNFNKKPALTNEQLPF